MRLPRVVLPVSLCLFAGGTTPAVTAVNAAGSSSAQLNLTLSAPATAFTYYVDSTNGSDTNPGTLAEPWKSIAKVNSTTLKPGQSIGFARGGVWREQLVVPNSGTAANPITYSAYGSGSPPKILASDVIDGSWSHPPPTKVTHFADNFNSGNTQGWSVVGSGVSFTGAAVQVVLSSTSGSHRIDKQFTASPLTEAWVEYQVLFSSGSSVPDGQEGMLSGLFRHSDGDPAAAVGYHNTSGKLYWKGYYSTNANQYAGTAVSKMAITTNTWHTVSIYTKFAPGEGGTFSYWVDGIQMASQTGLTNNNYSVDQVTLGENYIGSVATETAYYDNVSVYTGTDNANIWQVALATKPNIILFDGTVGDGHLNTMPHSLSTDLTWYWSANVLYVYSATNPRARFTTIEAGARDSAVDTAGKQFLIIDGLDLRHNNNIHSKGGITVAGAGNVIVQHCHLAYNAFAGIAILGAAGPSISVLHNESDHNNIGITAYQYTGAAPGTEMLISSNTIHDNGYVPPSERYGEAVQIYGNYVIVESNTIYNNGSVSADTIGIHVYADTGSMTYGQNNIIRNNVVSGQISNTLDGSGVETDHSAANNSIYGNVIYGNYGPCIDIFASSANVYGNTCYDNLANSESTGGTGEIAITDSGDNVATIAVNVRDNVVYATRPDSYAIYVDKTACYQRLTVSYNLFYGSGQGDWYFWDMTTGNSLAAFEALTGGSANLNADPRFTDAAAGDTTLQAGSPAIAAGIYIPTVSAVDPPNIGAR